MAEKTQVDIFGELSKIAKIGYVEKDAKVGNVNLTLSTLTAEDEAEVFNNCIGYDGISFISRNKIETLVYSIKAVNGERFNYEALTDREQYLVERGNAINSLRKVIGSMQEDMVSFLYSEQLSVANKGEEELKKAGINRQQDVENALAKLAADKKKIQEGKLPS